MSVFSFTPAGGVLGPQESQEIAVLFKPSEIGLVGRVRTVLQCDVKNGNPRYLRARSFGIFRNKNIFRNIFRNENPGIPE